MMLGRVMITGAGAQLASSISAAFNDREVIAHTRSTLDVTDPRAVAAAIAAAEPALIINCAAFNDVDGAEDRPLEALAVNAFAVRSLARAAEACGATLVHYSSDFVIDREASEPHSEDVRPSPRSTYAASKLLGEWFALAAPGAFVLRVESLFGSPAGWTGRTGTLEKIIEGLEQGREVRVFTDRIVSPSYTHDVAAATRYLVANHAVPGLYHCVNSGHATWHDVASEAAALLRVEPRLVPITTDQISMKAPRPRYCALSTRKLAAAGFEMPSWRDALQRWLAARSNGVGSHFTRLEK
jgi:dTDP-4-dehydrorhamnose reductase